MINGDFNNLCAERKDLSYNVHVKYLLISCHVLCHSSLY